MSRARVRALRAMRDTRNYGDEALADLDRKLGESLDPAELSASGDDEPSYDDEPAHQVAYHDPRVEKMVRDIDERTGKSLSPRRLAVK